MLEVEDVYYLLLEFPKIVNEDTASAVFNKKKRRLTLTAAVLRPINLGGNEEGLRGQTCKE